MATKLRSQKSNVPHEDCMKDICEQIAEIKRVVKEIKKKLTKEEKEAVRVYRHSMLERIQAVDEKYIEKETGIYIPRLKFTSGVFVKCNEIAKGIQINLKTMP